MIGILGVATHLPPQVRTNDWWDPETVAGWRGVYGPPALPEQVTDGMALVLRALKDNAADPFSGVVERRVLAADLSAADMEYDAAQRAIARAGIDRAQIGLLLTHTVVPEYLASNPSCRLHHRLGLPADCLSVQADATAYSFMAQVALAQAMLARGGGRPYALLVQSAVGSRLLDPGDPDSPVFGDGAAAVVLGPVPAGGILGSAHRTDGRYPLALVASVRGGRWYDGGGPIVLHRADPAAMAEVFLRTADLAKVVVDAALTDAALTPADVDFFAVHQGTAWLRQLTQEHTGLSHARTVDTFAHTGYLFGASLPLVLETATHQGALHPGDLVLLHGGGTGATYGAIALRWT